MDGHIAAAGWTVAHGIYIYSSVAHTYRCITFIHLRPSTQVAHVGSLPRPHTYTYISLLKHGVCVQTYTHISRTFHAHFTHIIHASHAHKSRTLPLRQLNPLPAPHWLCILPQYPTSISYPNMYPNIASYHTRCTTNTTKYLPLSSNTLVNTPRRTYD